MHFYDGAPLIVYLSTDGNAVQEVIINNNKDQVSHIVVRSGTWFSMESKGEYSLIGCTVAPPFNYDDFELAPKNWKPGKS